MKRTLVTALLAVSLTVTTGTMVGPQIARADQGGSSVNQTACFTIRNGVHDCVTTVGAMNDTVTPSGTESHVFNATQTIVFYDAEGTVITSRRQEVHMHFLVQQGVIYEEGNHLTFQVTLTSMTCTGSFDTHFVGGTLQYTNSIENCA